MPIAVGFRWKAKVSLGPVTRLPFDIWGFYRPLVTCVPSSPFRHTSSWATLVGSVGCGKGVDWGWDEWSLLWPRTNLGLWSRFFSCVSLGLLFWKRKRNAYGFPDFSFLPWNDHGFPDFSFVYLMGEGKLGCIMWTLHLSPSPSTLIYLNIRLWQRIHLGRNCCHSNIFKNYFHIHPSDWGF